MQISVAFGQHVAIRVGGLQRQYVQHIHALLEPVHVNADLPKQKSRRDKSGATRRDWVK